jgi:NAD(P)-dependent dehydrogenase (short-subunit alcohol dehydrogenase family)
MGVLEGKVAIVTGGSRGIGRAIALRLGEAGAHVVIASRNRLACDAVVSEIQSAGGRATSHSCDVSQAEALAGLVEETVQDLGGLDVLVCNAGTNPAMGPMSEVTDRQYERIFETNLRANFRLCNLAAPHLAKTAGAGVILSSITALSGSQSIGTYAMSKAALLQLTRNLALEWGPSQVRFNGVAPGLTRTDLGEIAIQTPEGRSLIARTPLRRVAEPDDIAQAVLFLASPAAAFITGQTLVVDGGITITDFA